MRPFGYHIQGGQYVGQSLKAASEAGFTAAQIFLGPPQTPKISPVSVPELRLFLDVKRSAGMKVFVHAPYVLHAFSKPESKHKNDHGIKKLWDTARNMEIDGFVLHMGGTKHYSGSFQEYIDVATELMLTLDGGAENPPILFENCANGNDMSGHLATICSLVKLLEARGYNVGLCLDTLHAWAWGYNYNAPAELELVTKHEVFDVLRLIHLNSAPEKVVCGGKYDRHECLSRGIIPVDILRRLIRYLPNIPIIAERENVVDVMDDWAEVKLADTEGEMVAVESGE